MTKLCPRCHQEIKGLDDLPRLRLQPSEWLILAKLWAHKGVVIPFCSFHHKTSSLRVYMSRIRTELLCTETPWTIRTVKDEGYQLTPERTDVQRKRAEGSSKGREGSAAAGVRTQ